VTCILQLSCMGVASLTIADSVSCTGVAWSTTDAATKLVE
jgi:hypothetical protein